MRVNFGGAMEADRPIRYSTATVYLAGKSPSTSRAGQYRLCLAHRYLRSGMPPEQKPADTGDCDIADQALVAESVFNATSRRAHPLAITARTSIGMGKSAPAHKTK